MNLQSTGFSVDTEHELKPVGHMRIGPVDAGRSACEDGRAGGVPEPTWEEVPWDDAVDEPIPFCQRRARRVPAEGWAVARVTDYGGERLVTGVRYLDACAGGLGLESSAPVEPGCEIVLHWQGQSDPSRFGVVRWCRPSDTDPDLWRLGVECVTPVAAA